jgi:hypothetical protein
VDLLNSLRDTLNRLRKREPLEDPAEKRRIYRVRCSLPVMVVVSNKEAMPGRLINLSSKGMKIHLERRLKVGQIYRIFVRGRTTWQDLNVGKGAQEVSLRATALWIKKSAATHAGFDIGFLFFTFAGMRTDDVIGFFRDNLQVPVPSSSQKRRFTRIRRPFEVEMTHPDARALTGAVRDLSIDGVLWTGRRCS